MCVWVYSDILQSVNQVFSCVLLYTLAMAAFLGAFANLRKATIGFVMSACPSIRPHGTSRLQLDGFSWNLIFENFRKAVEKIRVLLESDKNNGYCMWRPLYVFIISRSVLLRMRNVSGKLYKQYQNIFSFQYFFSTIIRFMRKCGKYCRAGQATVDNMAHAHCMLDN
jgi:hypothetical protein